MTGCSACLNGCGGARSDCPMVGELQPMPPRGRPSTYSQDVAAIILGRLCEGELLVRICEEAGMPGVSTVHQWRHRQQDFAEAYARAREMQGHALAEIATKEGMRAGDGLDAQSARVRMDAAKWLASKVAPKTYGDKIDLNHSGDLTLKQVPDDQLESRLALLLGKAGAVGAARGEGQEEGEAEAE